MELTHHFSVPTPLSDTWHSFNQLEEIAPCFPGAVLTSVAGDSFTGTVKVKLGPIAMMYSGTGKFTTRDEATHTVIIEAQGKDKRGNGTAGATVTAVLAADGSGGTTVDVSTEMNVTGKPAQFGRGVIQDISDKLLEQFVQCVIGKAGRPAAETGSAGGEGSGSGSGTTEPAGTESRNSSGAGAEPPSGAAETGSPQARSGTGRPPAAAGAPEAELDLGPAIWPVLAKRFGPAALAVLGVIVLAICLGRRKRR